MRLHPISFFLAAIVCLLLSPLAALACACCANPGIYYNDTVDLDDYRLSQLKRMRFLRTASLYLTEADIEEDAFGITQPKESYSLQAAFAGDIWRLTFRSGSSAGSLALPLPRKIGSYAADIHDGKPSPGGGPLLYKEWRLEGDIKGTGFFANGTVAPAKYLLVLQGRGNGCDNAEDFGHWRLEVYGQKAHYAFYGRLGRPAAAQE